MCSEQRPVVIDACHIGKQYHIYARPSDRLRQFWRSLWYRLSGRALKPCWRAFNALDDVSLHIRKGETVGIIGRNGSGKSTLLQIICGTLTPTSGTVRVQGRVAALLELGSGFNPEFTGRENVFLNASVLGLSNEQTTQRFDAIAAFADIGDFMDQPVKTYSSGMALRLAFAVIAHVDADVLIVDEALAVGDSFFTQKCMRFLRNFMKNGTVLFVSHDIEAVKALCGRVVWLDRSHLMLDGETATVCQAYLDALFAHQQGASLLDGPLAAPAPAVPPKTAVFRDPRQDFINASNLRNDIEVLRFNADSPAFGTGQATITGVRLLDEHGQPLSWVIGGETVTLEIEALAHSRMATPVLGFIVKDRMGQPLFGDNTALTPLAQPCAAMPGDVLHARFTFSMPWLAAGDYSAIIAIADGPPDNPVRHHWLHDGLQFRCTSQTLLTSGLVGIPMQDIQLRIAPASTEEPAP